MKTLELNYNEIELLLDSINCYADDLNDFLDIEPNYEIYEQLGILFDRIKNVRDKQWKNISWHYMMKSVI